MLKSKAFDVIMVSFYFLNTTQKSWDSIKFFCYFIAKKVISTVNIQISVLHIWNIYIFYMA